MKPEIESKLVDMLNWADGVFKTGTEFVIEQTPIIHSRIVSL
jgi:hypothetical protein